jgi:hypothetical protein
MNSEKEKCVTCGAHTKYNISDHIDTRYGYVEGMGQLCPLCYGGNETPKWYTLVDHRLILNTPNDMELGKKVRSAFFEETDMNRIMPFEKISSDR